MSAAEQSAASDRVTLSTALRSVGGAFHSAGNLADGVADGYDLAIEKIASPWKELRKFWGNLKGFAKNLPGVKPKKKPAADPAAEPAVDNNVVDLAARERLQYQQQQAAADPADAGGAG